MRLIGARHGHVALHLVAYLAPLALVAGDMATDVRIFSALLATGLIWISVVDLRHFLIPDLASLGLVLIGFVATATGVPEALSWHALAAGAAWGVFAGLAAAFRWIAGHDGLGLGDAKLAAAAGAWLGPALLPAMLLGASLGALVCLLLVSLIQRRPIGLGQVGIAFGPFLAFSTWMVWLFGPVI